MQSDCPCQRVEAETAFKVPRLMRRKSGLTPTGGCTRMGEDTLRVTLEDATSSLRQIVERVEGGAATLMGVYAFLHEANRAEMHGLAPRILARTVRDSALALDVWSADLTVIFYPAPVEA